MAKLHKSPSRGPSAQDHSFQSYSANPSNPGRNVWYAGLRPDPSSSASLVSRTMSYARGQLDSASRHLSDSYFTNSDQVIRRPAGGSNATSISRYANYNGLYKPQSYTYGSVPAPRTESERYWAYRAIVAEVKLAERMGARTDELERMKEGLIRQSAGGATHSYYEERVLRLERLALGLISIIVLITLILVFRHHSEDKSSNSKHRTFRPHLTIPILSPFTSIVEHEDSKFSFRTTAVFLIILGCLAYAMFRYWLHRRPR